MSRALVASGLDFNDHQLIWAKLGQGHERHPDKVLAHGKSPKGVGKIGSRWAKTLVIPVRKLGGG